MPLSHIVAIVEEGSAHCTALHCTALQQQRTWHVLMIIATECASSGGALSATLSTSSETQPEQTGGADASARSVGVGRRRTSELSRQTREALARLVSAEDG